MRLRAVVFSIMENAGPRSVSQGVLQSHLFILLVVPVVFPLFFLVCFCCCGEIVTRL